MGGSCEITTSLDWTPIWGVDGGTVDVPKSLSTRPSLYVLMNGERSWATSFVMFGFKD